MILIFGYLGFGNYGDELLATLLTEELKKKKGEIEILSLSKKDSLSSHLKKIYKAKEIYAIGGMFQDLSSYASPLYYFFVLLFAKALGKKIIIVAQGLGPLNYWFNIQFAKTIFRVADEVSVRNSYSSDLLKEWGVRHTVVPDLAWRLKEKFTHYDSEYFVLPKGFRVGEKYIFISLKQKEDAVIASIAKQSPCADWILTPSSLAQDDAHIVFLEMQDGDHFLHEKLARELNLKSEQCIYIEAKNYQPEELIYLLKNYCTKLITMRFHAMILAQIAGIEVEVLNPNNDPKLSSR